MEAVVYGVHGLAGLLFPFPSFHQINVAHFFRRVRYAEKMFFCQFSSFSQTPGGLAFIPKRMCLAHPLHSFLLEEIRAPDFSIAYNMVNLKSAGNLDLHPSEYCPENR